jgi:uncharacterized membrane-anchored protein YhcB (DUF1043 family)
LLQIARWTSAAILLVALAAVGILTYLLAERAQELEAKETALAESRQQLEGAKAIVSKEQANSAALTGSLNKR